MSDETFSTDEEPTRRDFIYVATGMLGVVGAVSLAWPFIDQMRPDAAVLAAGQPVDIDVSSVNPGMVITVTWRGRPYFVRRLTPEEIKASEALPKSDQKDPQPADERISGPADEEQKDWVVVSANCTHLGCIPKIVENGAEGFACPCHGSVYDMTGRILYGPAPLNLPPPPFVFASNSSLTIGTDKVAGA